MQCRKIGTKTSRFQLLEKVFFWVSTPKPDPNPSPSGGGAIFRVTPRGAIAPRLILSFSTDCAVVYNSGNANTSDLVIDRLCVTVERAAEITAEVTGKVEITNAYIGSISGRASGTNDSYTK